MGKTKRTYQQRIMKVEVEGVFGTLLTLFVPHFLIFKKKYLKNSGKNSSPSGKAPVFGVGIRRFES